MIPQTVDFIFSVCTFKSFHTIVLSENACCYTKLLETFGKTGHAFVNQPLLFLLKNWSYGYQIEVKQEHATLLIILSGLETSEWQPIPDFILFFLLLSWICKHKKKQIRFHGGNFCFVADTTSAACKLLVSMTQTLGFLTFLFIWALKSHLR